MCQLDISSMEPSWKFVKKVHLGSQVDIYIYIYKHDRMAISRDYTCSVTVSETVFCKFLSVLTVALKK